MAHSVKSHAKRGAQPKTREFDVDLEVKFTNKIGRIIPNVKITHQKNSQEEKKALKLTDDLVTSPEAALEFASTSPEALRAVANAYKICTFARIPNYLKRSAWCPYTYFERAYQAILDRRFNDDVECPPPQEPGAIDVFDAEMRYYEFQYLRFVHKAGMYDSPNTNLHPDHVDRLVSCGWLTAEDFDFDLGRVMLARGAYSRIARQTRQPDIDGKQKPSALSWTISRKFPKPDAKDVLEKISGYEYVRFCIERATREPPEVFELSLYRRPQLHHVWIETRRRENGLFGLKKFGISDERALEMIRTADASFVPPTKYNKKRVYGKIILHKPTLFEELDPRPLDKGLPEPQTQKLIIPDIYVTAPPCSDMEIDDEPIERPPPPKYDTFQGRKIARLPVNFYDRVSDFAQKKFPQTPIPPSPARPIITPKRLQGPPQTGLRRCDTTLIGWNNVTSSHIFIQRVNDNNLKRSAPAEFEVPAQKRQVQMSTPGFPEAVNPMGLTPETTAVDLNTEIQQPIFDDGEAEAIPEPEPEEDNESIVDALELNFDESYYLRVPLKKFGRRERECTPMELDFERPTKRTRHSVDDTIPQPEPTPENEEPARFPLLVGGVCMSYEPEDVKQHREELFRQHEEEDPTLYLMPKRRSGLIHPWFSDVDAKTEFQVVGLGIIQMVSTGRMFGYLKPQRIYVEFVPELEPRTTDNANANDPAVQVPLSWPSKSVM